MMNTVIRKMSAAFSSFAKPYLISVFIKNEPFSLLNRGFDSLETFVDRLSSKISTDMAIL